VPNAKRLKELEAENARLKKLQAGSMLENGFHSRAFLFFKFRIRHSSTQIDVSTRNTNRTDAARAGADYFPEMRISRSLGLSVTPDSFPKRSPGLHAQPGLFNIPIHQANEREVTLDSGSGTKVRIRS